MGREVQFVVAEERRRALLQTRGHAHDARALSARFVCRAQRAKHPLRQRPVAEVVGVERLLDAIYLIIRLSHHARI